MKVIVPNSLAEQASRKGLVKPNRPCAVQFLASDNRHGIFSFIAKVIVDHPEFENQSLPCKSRPQNVVF